LAAVSLLCRRRVEARIGQLLPDAGQAEKAGRPLPHEVRVIAPNDRHDFRVLAHAFTSVALTQEEWRQSRRNRAIADALGVDESTVREDLNAGNPAYSQSEALPEQALTNDPAGNPAPATTAEKRAAVRACVRIGELSRELADGSGPGRGKKVPDGGKVFKQEVLKSAGISTSAAQRYEKLAAEIEQIVAWWGKNVTPRHRPGRSGIKLNAERGLIPVDVAEKRVSVTQQQVSRWRARLKRREEFRDALYGASTHHLAPA
jgi:hypothetical protein